MNNDRKIQRMRCPLGEEGELQTCWRWGPLGPQLCGHNKLTTTCSKYVVVTVSVLYYVSIGYIKPILLYSTLQLLFRSLSVWSVADISLPSVGNEPDPDVINFKQEILWIRSQSKRVHIPVI